MKYLCVFLTFFSIKSNAQNFQWALDFQDCIVRWGETIDTDDNSNVYMAFPFAGTSDADPSSNQANHISNGLGDTCIAKYSSNGEYLWSVSFGGNSQDLPHRLLIDNENNVIVVGHFFGMVDFDPSANVFYLDSSGSSLSTYIVKYDSNGNFIWARNFGNDGTQCYSVDIDLNNNIYLAGIFQSTNTDFDVTSNSLLFNSLGYNDLFLLKIDSNGTNVFAKQIGSVSNDILFDIKVNKQNNHFCIIGKIDGTVDFDTSLNESNITPVNGSNAVIAKYDLDGNYLWAKSFENVSVNSRLFGTRINFDSESNIFFSGYFYENVDFDPDLGEAIFTSTPINLYTYEDSFICKLDSNGNYITNKTLSSIYKDQVIDFEFDSSNNLYAIGNFKGTLNFDINNSNYSETSSGEYDSYFIKLNNDLNFQWAHKIGNNGNEDRIKDIHIDTDYILLSGDYIGTIDVDLSDNNYLITSDNISHDAYLIKYNNQNLLSFDEINNDVIKLYPNPCENYLRFSSNTKIDIIEIINIFGQKIFYKSDFANSSEVNISELKSGIYIVLLYAGEKKFTKTIYKK